MENVVCAIAKNENKYINDQAQHHLNLGFDNIFIYDNNDNTTEYIGNFINDKIRDRVHILNINNKKLQQQNSYNTFYELFKHRFKWCAFIDVDEFIILNVLLFLDDQSFKDTDLIRLKQHLYGDDDLITRQFNRPIYEEIVIRLKGNVLENQSKSIVRSSLRSVKFISVHYPDIDDRVPENQYLSDGTKVPESRIEILSDKEEYAYINHYYTKTISEFIEQK